MTMTVSKSYTETSTLLPKSTNAVEEERPNWATIVSRGHQYLFPPPPSDDLISNAFAKYHEVTQMTKDLSYPRDEIKSQLTEAVYRCFSDVPLAFHLNTQYVPKREPLTIPHDASIELPHYLAFLDEQSQNAGTADLPSNRRADSLMTRLQTIKHEIMCRGSLVWAVSPIFKI